MKLQASPRNDLIITGLPRSGTSLLCFLLNSAENVAVINEPDEVFGIFLQPNGVKSFSPRRFDDLKAYYADLRGRLQAGEPVRNKLVIDTRHKDAHVNWQPRAIRRSDFLLGTKNTLLYTCHLPAIIRDEFRVIALVRHPYHSIGSWRSFDQRGRFAHLGRATIPFFGMLRPGAVGDDFKAAYSALKHEPNDLNDSCGFWNLLTRVYLHLRDQITILRYEDFVRNPRDSIRAIAEVTLDTPVDNNSSPRCHDISPDDQAFIWEQCRDHALALGYSRML